MYVVEIVLFLFFVAFIYFLVYFGGLFMVEFFGFDDIVGVIGALFWVDDV